VSVGVFGSVNLDLIFRLPRAPDPGETLLADASLLAPGGKGANQALAARRAGAAVRFAGSVGQDSLADQALVLLRADGVDLGALVRVAAPTGLASITVEASGENRIVCASGANALARAAQVPDSWFDGLRVLLMQMETPWPENLALLQRAKARGVRVLVNLAPAPATPPPGLELADLVIANEVETAFAPAGVALVRTLGADGVAFGDLRVPALPITPVDTTGAGDAFCGALAAALAEERPMDQALRFAAAAGSLACLAPGAQPSLPTRAAIEGALAQHA
jgi:ribokinase